MHMMKEDVKMDIYARNDHIAEHVREYLGERGIFAVNVMGAPGTGKTTSLEQLKKHLKAPIYVIEGDIESDIDTERLRKQDVPAAQINTFGACHLDAPLVHNAVHTMAFPHPGILFIENVGNLVCPAELTIGENIKLLILSVTDGSDKPYKYPLAFEKADIILLNKVDLLPYLDFDEGYFMKGLRHLNKTAPVFKVSGKTGEGYAEAARWLDEAAAKAVR
ncbi:MAG: hydrogenase nickel incorporation protein HypB [Succiniclasticum sp.]|jgi:hydrogenase nickel incorporation protein HypB